MENKALYHEVAIERENGSLDCLPATRYNFIAQTPTCPTHQLAPGSPTLYSASSSLLLRSAPGPCTTKKNSFQGRVECVRMKPTPHRGVNHRVCTGPSALR